MVLCSLFKLQQGRSPSAGSMAGTSSLCIFHEVPENVGDVDIGHISSVTFWSTEIKCINKVHYFSDPHKGEQQHRVWGGVQQHKNLDHKLEIF